MRPVERGPTPLNSDGTTKRYAKYANARRDLIARLGEYCSYCGMHLDSSLAVEHIQPKKHYPHLELQWGNYLLACTNCNSTKLDKNPPLDSILWPHLDNTFRAFKYDVAGVVKVAPGLSLALKIKAQATIKLTGLDKKPNKQDASDRRWLNRREAWQDANAAKADLLIADSPAMRRSIIRGAKAQGYWSIWMTVFSDDTDMLARLLDTTNFVGTAPACFDAQGATVARVGGQV
ncbi:MAG: HNH endonuclease [Algicola sp.]|nr:HNH endonuclease [Algicola sp.]